MIVFICANSKFIINYMIYFDELILLNGNSLIPIFYNYSFYFVTDLQFFSFSLLGGFFRFEKYSPLNITPLGTSILISHIHWLFNNVKFWRQFGYNMGINIIQSNYKVIDGWSKIMDSLKLRGDLFPFSFIAVLLIICPSALKSDKLEGIKTVLQGSLE